jgi:hypothetical protein
MGVRERDALEVRIADVWMRDQMDQTLRFVIWTMPVEGRMVTLNCMQLDIDALKTPARQAVLFRGVAVETILRRLAPGLRHDVAGLPVVEDYHLLPSMRPSRLIQRMAREKAAACFYRRGDLVFKKLVDLFAKEPDIEYEYQNPLAENQVEYFSRPNTREVIDSFHRRSFIGWNMVDGFLQSRNETARPVELVSMANVSTMDNLSKIAYPAIDFTASGNGALVPGATVKIVWNAWKQDVPIDESLPAKILIGTVSHWYSAQKYACRVKGVTI